MHVAGGFDSPAVLMDVSLQLEMFPELVWAPEWPFQVLAGAWAGGECGGWEVAPDLDTIFASWLGFEAGLP